MSCAPCAVTKPFAAAAGVTGAAANAAVIASIAAASVASSCASPRPERRVTALRFIASERIHARRGSTVRSESRDSGFTDYPGGVSASSGGAGDSIQAPAAVLRRADELGEAAAVGEEVRVLRVEPVRCLRADRRGHEEILDAVDLRLVERRLPIAVAGDDELLGIGGVDVEREAVRGVAQDETVVTVHAQDLLHIA